MSAARKPVIVRRLTRDWCAGYAAANLAGEGEEFDLLDMSGKLIRMPFRQVKWVCYVREMNSGDGTDALAPQAPERLLRRRFSGRPRIAGLWVRLMLSDGEELEGVTANDRTLVDGAGLLLIPPDTRSNTQRVFVPRSSIRELTVLGVIHPTAPSQPKTGAQPELFLRDATEDGVP